MAFVQWVWLISWQQHLTNKKLYGNLPKVSDKVAARRLKLAGHCLGHPELPASSSILWEPNHGRRSQGWPAKTMVDNLMEDTGMANTSDLHAGSRSEWVSYLLVVADSTSAFDLVISPCHSHLVRYCGFIPEMASCQCDLSILSAWSERVCGVACLHAKQRL